MSIFAGKSRILTEMMKFSYHHKAFYCYLGMSIWICFLITVMYKYMAVGEETIAIKKVVQNEYVSKSDIKFRRIHSRACNPPENIVRGSEGLVDNDAWLLHGALVVTRHGDRGPLTHLKGGDKLPCDYKPASMVLKSYEEFVANGSASGRAWWVSVPGPFHNFPSVPPRAPGTRCALGQLTPRGLEQMITLGNVLREAYADKLGLNNIDSTGKKDKGEVVSYSTRYRRTFQSLVCLWWGLAGGVAGGRGLSARSTPGASGMESGTGGVASGVGGAGGGVGGAAAVAGARAAAAQESHSVAFCFTDCACNAHHALNKKINSQAKNRLDSHPAIKELVVKLSKVLFESQEHVDADVVRDALLAYMCHDAPLPCSGKPTHDQPKSHKQRKLHSKIAPNRKLLDVDIDTLNMELDYINNQVDFNNEFGRKARDIIGKYYDSKDKKAPLDFDAQMEREKLLYYQQRYIDNAEAYDDVVIVKKNLDADFNFPNDARMDTDFDEDYKDPTPDSTEDFCIRKDHVISLFAYLEWSYRQEIRNVHNRRRGLLVAYGLIHNIVQNMIRMISENKPKFVLYSGHDKTLQALILALGLNNYQHYNIQYASRMIFEVYRKKDLTDEFKFTKRKPVAQDFYFRVVYNGEDVTNKLTFCKAKNILMNVVDPADGVRTHRVYLCPIENIVRFIHDDFFAAFNASNFKDACASYGNGKRNY